MMKKLILISFMILLAVGLAFSGCAKPAEAPSPAPSPAPAPEASTVEPIVLTFAGGLPEQGSVAQDIWKPWFADIEKATGGKVKIQPYYGESLCPYGESYAAVTSGVADIAQVVPQHVPGRFPLSDVMMLSTYGKICYGYTQAHWGTYQKFPELQAEFDEVKVLGIISTAPVPIFSIHKPLSTLEDCQGQKWNVGGRICTMRAEALGAVPVSLPPPAVYEAMEKGVVDGGAGQPEWLSTFSLGEVVKYMTLVNFNATAEFYLIRWEKWNTLPADSQKAIDEVSGSYLAELADRATMSHWLDDVENAEKEFGVEVIYLSPEEAAKWIEVDKPVVEAVIAEVEGQGLPGRKVYEEFVKLEEKYSASEYKPTS